MEDKIDENAGIGGSSKKAAEQAIPPSAPAFILDTFKAVKEPPEVKITDDGIISEGADSDFWKILKRYITAKQTKIKQVVQEKFNTGTLSMEQIGLQSLMRDAVFDNLQDIINKVEGTRDVVEQQKIKEQEKKANDAKQQSSRS